MKTDLFSLPFPEFDTGQKAYVKPRVLQTRLRQRFQASLREDALAELIPGLPEIDTQYHIVTGGVFNMWNWVPLMASRLGTIDDLWVASWMINDQATTQLVEMLKSGLIAKCSVVTGLYFQSRARSCWNQLTEELPKYGGRIVAADNHAKILLIHANDNWIVVEGSSNLTQNTRVEQNVVTNNKELFDFHQSWIDSLFPKRKHF